MGVVKSSFELRKNQASLMLFIETPISFYKICKKQSNFKISPHYRPVDLQLKLPAEELLMLMTHT